MFKPGKQNRDMIEDRPHQLLAVSHALRHCTLQMVEGARILSGVEFGQSEQSPARPCIGPDRHELPERVAGLGILVRFVEHAAEVPKSLFRLRLYGKRTTKQSDSLVILVGIARLFAGLNQLIDTLSGRRGGSLTRDQAARENPCAESSD